MSVREAINSKPRLSLGIVIGIAIVAIAFAIWSMDFGDGATVAGTAFYSNDDGKTFFIDEPGKIGLVKDGKPAVIAHVFEDPTRGQFVGYLERLTPAAEKAALASQSSGAPSAVAAAAMGREIKRPGDTRWVSPSSEEGMRVMSVRLPGGTEYASRVEPR
jgi:hypothetical protein